MKLLFETFKLFKIGKSYRSIVDNEVEKEIVNNK